MNFILDFCTSHSPWKSIPWDTPSERNIRICVLANLFVILLKYQHSTTRFNAFVVGSLLPCIDSMQHTSGMMFWRVPKHTLLTKGGSIVEGTDMILDECYPMAYKVWRWSGMVAWTMWHWCWRLNKDNGGSYILRWADECIEDSSSCFGDWWTQEYVPNFFCEVNEKELVKFRPFCIFGPWWLDSIYDTRIFMKVKRW